MEFKRDDKIDILKAIAIILMVADHAGFKYKGLIDMFHMSVFIMASGYCFRERNGKDVQNLKSYLGKKLIWLYIPYVVFNTIFILLYNKLIDWHIYTSNAEISTPRVKVSWDRIVNSLINLVHFEPSANQQLCGAAWFIIVLFYITVGFVLIYFVANRFNKYVKHVLIISSAIIMLWIGSYLNKIDMFLQGYASPAFTGYALYVLGYYISKLPQKIKDIMDKFDILIATVGLPIIVYMWKTNGGISLNNNQYPSVNILLCAALVGWLWLMSLSSIIKKINFGKVF